jgi:hypothetical protein
MKNGIDEVVQIDFDTERKRFERALGDRYDMYFCESGPQAGSYGAATTQWVFESWLLSAGVARGEGAVVQSVAEPIAQMWAAVNTSPAMPRTWELGEGIFYDRVHTHCKLRGMLDNFKLMPVYIYDAPQPAAQPTPIDRDYLIEVIADQMECDKTLGNIADEIIAKFGVQS